MNALEQVLRTSSVSADPGPSEGSSRLGGQRGSRCLGGAGGGAPLPLQARGADGGVGNSVSYAQPNYREKWPKCALTIAIVFHSANLQLKKM